MVEQYLGIAGLALLLIAWMPETIQNWKEKGKNLNLKFVLLYFFGSLFLALHAVAIGDMPFFVLNALATLIALFNACLIFMGKNAREKKKKAK